MHINMNKQILPVYVCVCLSLSRSVLSCALSLCLSPCVSVSFSLPLSLSLLHFRRVAEPYRHPVYSRMIRLFIRATSCAPFHIHTYILEHTCVPPPLCIPGRFSFMFAPYISHQLIYIHIYESRVTTLYFPGASILVPAKSFGPFQIQTQVLGAHTYRAVPPPFVLWGGYD